MWQWLQALDKIRFEGLTDKSKLDAQPELFIGLVPDKANKCLTIIDSGIGMSKAGKYTRILIYDSYDCMLMFSLINLEIIL